MQSIGWDVYKLAKSYGAVFTDDRHFVDDCTKLVEEKLKSHNTPQPKIASSCISCQKMVFCSKSIEYQSDACKQLRASA